MAKKKSGRGFTMAAEMRNILEEQPGLSGREATEALKKKFPGQSINEGSASVAFSEARKKLGITKGRKKVVRKKRPSSTRTKAASPAQSGSVTFDQIEAAQKFSRSVGGTQQALEAIKAWQKLESGM